MNILLCHTPLHILIGMLLVQQDPSRNITFVVVEDTDGLHFFAKSLIATSDAQLFLLPGTSHGKSALEMALIQRKNARLLRRVFSKRIESAFVFHDLRAESQALLNIPERRGHRIRFVLLEDGVALYEPHGFLVGGLTAVLKRKLFFDLRWKHARELGLHPRLTEVRCFYPKLLRANLRHLKVSALPTSLPDGLSVNLPKISTSGDGPFALIAVPHSSFVTLDYLFDFLSLARDYCERNRMNRLLKFHPSDRNGPEIVGTLMPDSPAISQWAPLELFLLSQAQMVSTFIGTRTSALHVSKAMIPSINCIYYDRPDSTEGQKWINFLDAIGVSPLS